MIKNLYKVNWDFRYLDLQEAKNPYHQIQYAVLKNISLKKPTKFFCQARVFITLKVCNFIFNFKQLRFDFFMFLFRNLFQILGPQTEVEYLVLFRNYFFRLKLLFEKFVA